MHYTVYYQEDLLIFPYLALIYDDRSNFPEYFLLCENSTILFLYPLGDLVRKSTLFFFLYLFSYAYTLLRGKVFKKLPNNYLLFM